MSDEQRRKLTDWFLSVLIIVLMTNTSMAAYWFFNRPDQIIRTRMPGDPLPSFALSLVDYAGPIGEQFMLLAMGMIPAFLWHGADLLEIDRQHGRVGKMVSSASTFHATMFALGLFMTLQTTGWFTYTALCGASFQFLMQSCYHTKGVISLPIIALLLLLLFLCMGKAVISIRSRFQKVP